MLWILGAGAVVVGSIILHVREWRHHRQEQLQRSQDLDYAAIHAGVAGGS